MRMNLTRNLAITMFLLWGMHAPVYAEDRYSENRGELLYATHCTACHDEQVHWREKKRVTDWDSLVTEVRRWQDNLGLAWNASEIVDTARYLNAVFYHFGEGGGKDALGEGRESNHVWKQK
jgi:hypothetical protein